MANRYEDRYTKAKERYKDDAEDTPDEGDGEEYDENADEDFDIEAAEADGDASSSDDDEQPQSKAKANAASSKRKADTLGDLDSGDEETIKARNKKKKKQKKKSKVEEDDDESEDDADDGGLIKTRAQRLVEMTERKYKVKAQQGDVTIDVDAVWQKLNSMPLGRRATPPPPDLTENADADKENFDRPPAADTKITIKRRIQFAGQITEVDEEVLKSSKEAQDYLKNHPETDPDRDAPKDVAQRPLKRPSMFEPNPLCLVKGVPPEKLRRRAPSRQDVIMMERKAEEARAKKAERMTTVQKSALDWKAHVEKAGLREELDEYGRSNATFLGREAFLDRAAGAREDRAREARLKG